MEAPLETVSIAVSLPVIEAAKVMLIVQVEPAAIGLAVQFSAFVKSAEFAPVITAEDTESGMLLVFVRITDLTCLLPWPRT